MTITATVENDTIKLPAGTHLPDGTMVKIETVEQPPLRKTFGERYAKYIGTCKGGPTDLADNHDHHLYGTAKRRP